MIRSEWKRLNEEFEDMVLSENTGIKLQNKTLKQLRNVLRNAGFDFVISRTEGSIVHINVFVEREPDVHS